MPSRTRPAERGAPVAVTTLAVLGAGHLGAVTAAGLASCGHDVAVCDPDPSAVERLDAGEVPFGEPGLADLLAEQRSAGRLRCEHDRAAAVAGCEVLWIALDTPVDEHDRADVGAVVDVARDAIAALSQPATVVVSSQVPPGTTEEIARWAHEGGHAVRSVAHVPENLRVGRAVGDFAEPGHWVIGADDRETAELLVHLLPAAPQVRVMSPRSAELVKAARNSFLAVSVALANEVGAVAERCGVDGSAVAEALRLDPRIGPHAYVRPGAPFSGATLARDVSSLLDAASSVDVGTPVLAAALESNRHHCGWAVRALEDAGVAIDGAEIAVLGLTYKPGTTTLRRSWPVELCRDLVDRGARVTAHHPGIGPAALADAGLDELEVAGDVGAAAAGADALVVASPLAGLEDLQAEDLLAVMRGRVVIDPDGTCSAQLAADPRIHHRAVGTPSAGGGAGGRPGAGDDGADDGADGSPC